LCATSLCLLSDKYKTHKYSVGRTYNCWMLNCWCITWPVGFKRLICVHFISFWSTSRPFITTFGYLLSSSFPPMFSSPLPRFSIYFSTLFLSLSSTLLIFTSLIFILVVPFLSTPYLYFHLNNYIQSLVVLLPLLTTTFVSLFFRNKFCATTQHQL
jgi:hypothetical protein